MAAARSAPVAKFLISAAPYYSATRRGMAHASVSQGLGHVSSGTRPKVVNDRSNEPDNSWGPDPVTGFYRPVNRAAEMDVADVRNMLLKMKNRARAN